MAVAIANNVDHTKFFDSIDPDDPEYIRQLLRPPDVSEDVRLMEQRSRVTLILQSTAFRKELDKAVASHVNSGQLTGNVLALREIVDALTPHTRLGFSAFTKCATMPVVPVNDLRASEKPTYSKPERMMRCKLASSFRLSDLFRWNVSSLNPITTRLTREPEQYLINPQGLLFHEITASSLIKIDLKGNIIDQGSTFMGIDRPGWMLHSAVYEARPDIRCIIHLNTPATIGVSCMKSGLLPISQEAMTLGPWALYDPSTFDVYTEESLPKSDDANVIPTEDLDEKPASDEHHEPASVPRRRRDVEAEYAAIGQAINKEATNGAMVLIVRSHGILVCGQSIEEAWANAYTTVFACEAQLRLACIGEEQLILPPVEACQRAHATAQSPSTVHLFANGISSPAIGATWRPGELEFEAMMRRLDAAGYKTGYFYRLTQLNHAIVGGTSISPREAAAHARSASLGRGLRAPRSDVEIPPSASSFATSFYGDEESRAAAAFAAKEKSLSLQRTHWCNTPNQYAKKGMTTPNESSTGYPGISFTRWEPLGASLLDQSQAPELPKRKSDSLRIMGKERAALATLIGGASAGLALPIMDRNQFAPQGENPKELKEQQKRIRARYYQDVKSAGPRSRLLEGVDDADDEGDGGPTLGPGGSTWSGTMRAASPLPMPPASAKGTLKRLDPSAGPVQVEPGHVVVVGAASRGIILRDHQYDPTVYQAVYSPNPFEHVTNDDLERYQMNVIRKAEGLPSLEEEEAARIAELAGKEALLLKQAVPVKAIQQLAEATKQNEANAIQPRQITTGLTVSSDQIRSDTSGADASHDDTEKEIRKAIKKDKKKRRFKMPSFARKSKDKEKK